MTAVHETAYPRFKSNLATAELHEIYTPTNQELLFARRNTNSKVERLGLLVWLKTIQRMGFFLPIKDVPADICSYIAQTSNVTGVKKSNLLKLDATGAQSRIRNLIRRQLNIKLFGDDGVSVSKDTAMHAANTMQELSDIINVMIEELIRLRFELPKFSRLLRIARTARSNINNKIYNTISDAIPRSTKNEMDQLLVLETNTQHSGWQELKREPKKPTNKEIKSYLNHLAWLREWVARLPKVDFIAASKWRQFEREARTYDAAQLKRMKSSKRYALVTILIHAQLRKAMDNVVKLLTRKIAKLHNNAKQKLQDYHLNRAKQIDTLLEQFHDILRAYHENETDGERLNGIKNSLSDSPENLMQECHQHLAYSGDNYYSFMLGSYQNQRSLLLNCLL